MKNTVTILLTITTIVLVVLAVMSFYNVDFPTVFYITCGGQALFIFTVYKVLTDDYSTEKTFDDWYEDHPLDNQ